MSQSHLKRLLTNSSSSHDREDCMRSSSLLRISIKGKYNIKYSCWKLTDRNQVTWHSRSQFPREKGSTLSEWPLFLQVFPSHFPIHSTVHRGWTEGSSTELWHSHRPAEASPGAQGSRVNQDLRDQNPREKGPCRTISAQLLLLRYLPSPRLWRTERLRNQLLGLTTAIHSDLCTS